MLLNKFIKCLALLILLNLTTTHAAEVKKVDRIIAVVDQSVITEQELLEKVRSVKRQMSQKGAELPDEAVLQKQVLERLIIDSLQLQFAAQTGVKVDDGQLDKTIERIAEQNKLGIVEFKKALENDGISYYKFREDVRNEITIARLKEREIDNRVTISEGEIDNYLTTQEGRAGEQDDYAISQILIRTPEDATPDDLQKASEKTKGILKALSEGMSFAKASATYSDAPNALEGGDLGWKNAKQIPPLFLEQLKSMNVGDISAPMRSPGGIHILKLNEKRSADNTMVITQTHVRHILLKPSEILSDKEAEQKLIGLKERLEHGSKFEEFARQYSEDGSAANGGDLGWVNPGDTVPQFEQAMSKLAPDEISAPIRTPFGWHLIQVIERRKQDMTKESTRLKARQEIRAKKIDEEYNNWISELRDRAFVELKLEDKF
jgi:peptidyl-prolyl cis-trans isomerase SurA